METYIFFRKETFYLIELRDDLDAIANAKCNPAIRVENVNGEIIWEQKN
jgi:hypothetical protein